MAPTWEKFRDLAIRTIIGEAGNQPAEGQIAVAHVIKNRADSGAWGDSSQGGAGNVIRAPKQFSLWNAGDKAGDMARSVDPNSPIYQRVGAIVDGVFNGKIADPTGGATHYYNPSVANPGWGQGAGQMIGAHKFMKLALNAGNTAGTAAVSPSSVGQGQSAPAATPAAAAPSDADAASAKAYLSTLSAHKDRAGDTSNMNPQFAIPLAKALQQARAEGLPVGVMSGYRAPSELTGQGVSSSAQRYDMAGMSSHSYGLATDISGLDGPNGKITKRWAQIAEANGINNPYGTGDAAEFNHWQIGPKLETTPALLESLKAAKATGDMSKVWAAYNGASPESQVANRQTYPPVAGPAPANVPAANATPATATAPGSSGGKFAVPPAPGSDKYSVIQGMTSGTSRNPMLYTAANFGNLFGGGAPSAPPAAAPAAVSAPSSQPASAPLPPVRPADAAPAAPIDTNNPLPWQGPPQGPPTPPTPPAAPPTLPSLSSNWGAAAPYAVDASDTDRQQMPGGGGRLPGYTPGQPSMGFPAQTNPFGQPQDQASSLPGSMFASAQNLIKALFG